MLRRAQGRSIAESEARHRRHSPTSQLPFRDEIYIYIPTLPLVTDCSRPKTQFESKDKVSWTLNRLTPNPISQDLQISNHANRPHRPLRIQAHNQPCPSHRRKPNPETLSFTTSIGQTAPNHRASINQNHTQSHSMLSCSTRPQFNQSPN